MASLIFNEVLRLDGNALDVFYRVVATPGAVDVIWLAYIGPWRDAGERSAAPKASAIGSLTKVARATLLAMERDG